MNSSLNSPSGSDAETRADALAWLAVTCAIWFATVYLGHHYVVDVLGGVVYGTVGYLLVKRLMRQS